MDIWPQTGRLRILGEFKFGGKPNLSCNDGTFILAIRASIAKPPNLIHHQYFHLYTEAGRRACLSLATRYYIVSATHLLTILTLQANMLISLTTKTFCAGDEHFWRSIRTHFTLEMTTLALETQVLKTCIRASATHTNSYSYESLSSRIMSR